MQNKNTFLKLGIFSLVMGGLGLSFTSAVTLFHLNINGQRVMSDTVVSKNIIKIHFNDNGNNFGGFLYFSNGFGDEDWEDGDDGVCSDSDDCFVRISGDTDYKCNRQMKGFYYNAERGERLWPLDDETLNSWGMDGSLSRNGGLFTRCVVLGYEDELLNCERQATDGEKDYEECKNEIREKYKVDEYGYYGYLEHEYKGQEMVLVSGVEYDTSTDFVSIKSDSKLVPTFVRFRNLYPVGFMYDYNGGVGVVGCRLTGGKTVKQVLGEIRNEDGSIDLKNIFRESNGNIIYTGAGMDCSDAVWDPLIGIIIEGIIGMGERSEFEVIGNQKDEKMQYFSSADINNTTLINYAKKKAEILCRGKWNKSTSSDVVCYKDQDVSIPKGKTVIIKNGNGIISPETSSNPELYYDVFINSGYLIINETDDKFVFTKNGFINTSSNVSSFNIGVDSDIDDYNGDDVAVGSYIKGNFIVNGRVKGGGEGGKLKNKYFIHGKFTTMDNFTTLLDTFAWRCVNGISTKESDDTQYYCPPTNNYAVASLVVIDQNYDSPFFNN